MEKFQCKFCKKILSNKNVLKNHQNSAKYCLKIQGKKIDGKFKCKECKKIFTRKHLLVYHENICIKSIISKNSKKFEKEKKEIIDKFSLEKKEMEENHYERIMRKDITILSQRKIIKELKQNIANLQKQLENVAIKAVSRPSYTSNKNIQINNYIQKMEPLCLKDIEKSVPMLTLDYHVKGAEGYAEYALEFPFKNKIVCVDVSRNKIKYKNEDGDLIEDVGFRKMMTKLCNSLKDRSFKLCQDHYEKLANKYSEEEVDNSNFDFMEAAKAIHKYASGRESDFCNKIIKLISKGSKK